MRIKDFRDLDVWKKGMGIVKIVYDTTNSFPREELYVLTSQMRRAAISIPSNIAEGFNRKHNKEYRQFLYIGLGSCGELETHCEIAHGQSYITKPTKNKLVVLIQHESKMLTNLIRCLK